jgi:hypothetical protein
MKRLFLAIIMLLIPVVCWAPPMEVCKASGRLTSDQSIQTTPGYLCGVVIETDGDSDHDVTAIIYPSSAKTAGTEIFKMIVEGGDYRGGAVFPKPIAASGMYLDIGGTGAAVIIYYMAQ